MVFFSKASLHAVGFAWPSTGFGVLWLSRMVMLPGRVYRAGKGVNSMEGYLFCVHLTQAVIRDRWYSGD